MRNLHWAYFWDYFQEKPSSSTFEIPNLREKNEKIVATLFRKDLGETLVIAKPEHTIILRTTYPGLVMGTGLLHETHSKEELKLGLSLDFTTGLPLIPGSSVKGLLRSVFRLKSGEVEFINYLLQYEIDSSLRTQQPISLKELALEIFGPEEDQERSYALATCDLFYDAIIDPSHTGTFLATDYITPHINRANPAMSRFTNPTPIPFLKIKPNVPIRFQFELKDRPDQLLTIAQRKALFEAILRFTGAGAKTRVGYGQFQ